MRIWPDLPPGLFGDDSPWAARGRYRDASHVRFTPAPEIMGGWEALTPETATGVCRSLFAWTDGAAAANVALGTHRKLQLWRGGGFHDITPAAFAPGAEHGAGGAGYGTGTYSSGAFSEPSTTDYFPLTWSFGVYGQNLIACPRGQTLYRWSNATSTPAQPLAGAPAKAAYVLTTPQNTILALGCAPEGATAANPVCIRECDPGDPTAWSTAVTNLARQKLLEGGGRLVAGRVLGLETVFAWTDQALYQGVWTGDPATPRVWYRVAGGCGLIAPGAAAVLQQTAYWLSPDGQFFRCMLGGAPEAIACPIQKDLWENLAPSQADKIVASTTSRHGEIRWDYPDARDAEGLEVSRAVVLNPAFGWTRTRHARTARTDAGAIGNPLAVTPDRRIVHEERGGSADGGKLAWSLETNDFALGEGDQLFLVRSVLPDVQGQRGTASLTLRGRMEAQGPEGEPLSITVGPADGPLDVLLSARIARWRLEGASSPATGRFGRIGFEVTPQGLR